MVIELHQDNRALDAEVERIVATKATNPAKIRLVKVLLYLLKLDLASLGRVVKKEFVTYG